ncbi:hypothetical protein [Kocuria rhizophila]|uniref:hypothetical protein n=1 Tax=Kocuria rhizophila TaxID=72000 RepID=UPI00119D9ACA|nr:hypothetical protein [Kocuria rhizophila]
MSTQDAPSRSGGQDYDLVPAWITAYDLEVMQNPHPVIVHIFPDGALQHGIETITAATAYCGHSWIPRERQTRSTGLRPQEAMCDECMLRSRNAAGTKGEGSAS